MPRIVRPDWTPKLRNKKGRAVVAIPGRGDVYLGAPFGSDEAARRYRAMIAEWQATGAVSRPGRDGSQDSPLIVELAADWWERFVERQCSPSVKGELWAAMKHLRALYDDMPAADFRPVHLITVRERMLESGVSRPVANRYTGKIRRMFKWAATHERIPYEVYARLVGIEPIPASRQDVHDPEPVGPVDDDLYEATIAVMKPETADVLRLMRYSGARPSEILMLRWRHIDMKSNPDLWAYSPPTHKTKWKGKTRVIYFGPRCQEILRRHATTEDRRLFPIRRDSLRQAVRRATMRAFPHPKISRIRPSLRTMEEREELKRWQQEHFWHPNQLRHTRATELRRLMGLDAAGAVLGHSGLDVTQVYAERDADLARRAAQATG